MSSKALLALLVFSCFVFSAYSAEEGKVDPTLYDSDAKQPYAVENVEDARNPDLHCPICTNLCENPICICPMPMEDGGSGCGNSVCQSCLELILASENKSCPHCRSEFNSRRVARYFRHPEDFVANKRIIDVLAVRVKCLICAGEPFTGTFGDFKRHLRTHECPDCRELLLPGDDHLSLHLGQFCEPEEDHELDRDVQELNLVIEELELEFQPLRGINVEEHFPDYVGPEDILKLLNLFVWSCKAAFDVGGDLALEFAGRSIRDTIVSAGKIAVLNARHGPANLHPWYQDGLNWAYGKAGAVDAYQKSQKTHKEKGAALGAWKKIIEEWPHYFPQKPYNCGSLHEAIALLLSHQDFEGVIPAVERFYKDWVVHLAYRLRGQELIASIPPEWDHQPNQTTDEVLATFRGSLDRDFKRLHLDKENWLVRNISRLVSWDKRL